MSFLRPTPERNTFKIIKPFLTLHPRNAFARCYAPYKRVALLSRSLSVNAENKNCNRENNKLFIVFQPNNGSGHSNKTNSQTNCIKFSIATSPPPSTRSMQTAEMRNETEKYFVDTKQSDLIFWYRNARLCPGIMSGDLCSRTSHISIELFTERFNFCIIFGNKNRQQKRRYRERPIIFFSVFIHI